MKENAILFQRRPRHHVDAEACAGHRRHAAIGVVIHFGLRRHHRQLALERHQLLIVEEILGTEARAVHDDRLAQGRQFPRRLELADDNPSTPELEIAHQIVEVDRRFDADLRRKNGVADPYKVEHWCLGNEMDGPWQIGHMSATEYGYKAADAARQMRYVDNSLKLIACGSSSSGMPTYLEWDREVLEQCYEYVDGLSLHRYFDNSDTTGGDSAHFLAMNLTMDRQITESLAVCDLVRGHKRSPKQLWLSFDEWNVWYRERRGDAVDGHKTSAPHLLEEIYNLEDALLVGGLLNTLIRNSNRVKIGCLAQLVNVIAPIMTDTDGIFLQTIFYPYSWALQYARGAALDVMVESSSYDVKGLYGSRDEKTTSVPHLDVSGSYDAATGSAVAFILNRDLAKAHEVEIVWEDKAPAKVQAAWVLTGDDLKAVNSFTAPKKVVPAEFVKPTTSNGRTKFEVPAKSYTMVQWGM